MTRESRARWLAFITAAVVVLLAALFSVLRNLPAPARSAAAAATHPEGVAKRATEPTAATSAAAGAPAAPAAPDHGAAAAATAPAPMPAAPASVPGQASVAPIENRPAQPQSAREPPPSPDPSPQPQAPTRRTNGSSPADATPVPPAQATPSAPARATGATAAGDPERIVTGERAYTRLGCAGCHSIAGRGRPSRPLDGVGSRRDRQALLEFTTGTGGARDALGAGLARRKARAIDDPDLDALIDYLAQLK
jgi:hypothetical protein